MKSSRYSSEIPPSPWEEIHQKTVQPNPGEVAGLFKESLKYSCTKTMQGPLEEAWRKAGACGTEMRHTVETLGNDEFRVTFYVPR